MLPETVRRIFLVLFLAIVLVPGRAWIRAENENDYENENENDGIWGRQVMTHGTIRHRVASHRGCRRLDVLVLILVLVIILAPDDCPRVGAAPPMDAVPG